MTDKTRELFEAWASKPQPVPNQNYAEAFNIEWGTELGRYKCPLTRAASDGYQAAFAHQQAIIDRLEEEITVSQGVIDGLEGEVVGLRKSRDLWKRMAIKTIEEYQIEALSHTTTKEPQND